MTELRYMIRESALRECGINIPKHIEYELECEEEGRKFTLDLKFFYSYGICGYPIVAFRTSEKNRRKFHIEGTAHLSRGEYLPKKRLALQIWPPRVRRLDDPTETIFASEWSISSGLEEIYPDNECRRTIFREAKDQGIYLSPDQLSIFYSIQRELKGFCDKMKEYEDYLKYHLLE